MCEGRYYYPHCTDKIDVQRDYIIYSELYKQDVLVRGSSPVLSTLEIKLLFPLS